MKIKNINLTLLVLGSLLASSFAFYVAAQENQNGSQNIFLDSDQDGLTDQEERLYGTDPQNPDTDGDGYSDGPEIKAGYDPKKPAPGDNLFPEESVDFQKTPESEASDNEAAPEDNTDASSADANLTNQLAAKISVAATETDPDKQQLTMEEIQQMVSDALGSDLEDPALPEISKEDIEIKEQDYSDLSEDEQKEKKKEDFSDYIVSVFYIFSSNSPKPLTSSSDIMSVSADISQEIINALSTQDMSSLSELSESGERMLDQLKDVEVPEELVDIHLKALAYAQYAKGLETSIQPNADDPVSSMVQLSKVEGLISSLMGFADDVQQKFSEYDLTFDSDLNEKIKDMGIDLSGSDLKDVE